MDISAVKDRANSLVSFMNGKGKIDSSPEFRPCDNFEIPPPISLSPSVMENSKLIKDLLSEKEQDKYLIDVLKRLSFDQAKEIEKLKAKIENLQKDYEKLLTGRKKENVQSIIETINSRSRSESVNE
jgi:hypothetical protein